MSDETGNGVFVLHSVSGCYAEVHISNIIFAHLVYQFIEVFVHRHCTGHYPIAGRSGFDVLFRSCYLTGYYHNTAFILWAKIRKRFDTCRTLRSFFVKSRA